MKKRIIKFKAKCINNGKWIEGDLLHNKGKCYISVQNVFCNIEKNIHVEVDSSTICQFIGLKDKNGIDVWEHDILTKDDSIIYEVGYEDCGFKASILGENEFIYNIAAVCKYNHICGNKFDKK